MFTGKVDFGESHIEGMLKRARFTGEYVTQILFLKDSLDITPEERQKISVACEASEEDHIVITHGTDTMVETAQALTKKQSLGDKTIILTGAMIPFSVDEGKDAMFNLGSALAYVGSLPSGVYIAMNGQAFEAKNVRKDREAGVFKPAQ